jgi:hypothetical protein
VTRLKTFKMFLGFDWLQVVNPKIDWQQMTIQNDEVRDPLQMRIVQDGPGLVPDYTKLYPEVFSEEGFKELPPWQLLDHIIDVKLDTTPPQCFPLSMNEREELQHFIQTIQKWEPYAPA